MQIANPQKQSDLCTGPSAEIFVIWWLCEAAQGIIVCGVWVAESRKPPVPMIIETVYNQVAANLGARIDTYFRRHQQSVAATARGGSQEKPMVAVGSLLFHPERFQPDFAKWRYGW